VSPLVGVKGAKPHCRSPQRAKFFLAPTFCEAKLGNKSLLLFFADAALEALRKGEFRNLLRKRDALQERASLTVTKSLFTAHEVTAILSVQNKSYTDNKGGGKMKNITHLIFDWGDTLMADDPDIKQAMYLWDKITVMQGVAETMPYLHGKYVCTVGSNAGESDALAMKKAFERVSLDGCFDYYFTSKELGARKPDTAFFDSIVQKLGTVAENTVMIGNDYAKDISGAKKAGLKTVLITAEKGVYPDADFVVKSFDEIKDIF